MHSLAGTLHSLRAWLNAGLGFVYPEICQLCKTARAGPQEGFVCRECRAQVRPIVAPFCQRCGFPFSGAITQTFTCDNCRELEYDFISARSAVKAQDQVLEAIHQYKYHRALWFEPFLVDLFVPCAAAALKSSDWDWIVPVPLHPLKQREREFNQAERFARPLSVATGIPFNEHLLRRARPTATQTRLSRDERVANMRNAFSLRKRPGLEGRRVVLVDDVFTTGATTNNCAKVLRAGGAAQVCVWTVARGV
jgi:competence protein ComFC